MSGLNQRISNRSAEVVTPTNDEIVQEEQSSIQEFYRLFKKLIIDHYSLLSVVIAVVLTILTAFIDFANKLNDISLLVRNWTFWFFISLSIFYIYAAWVKHNYDAIFSKTIDKVQEYYNKKLNTQKKFYEDSLSRERTDALNDTLQEISKKLEFTEKERISLFLYIDEETRGCFKCLGRYSHNYSFNKLDKSQMYPDKSGIIAKVWHQPVENGVWHDTNIPKFNKKNKTYINYMIREYGMEEADIKSLGMKPIEMYAEVMRNNAERQVAVIVLESNQKNKISQDEFQNIYQKSFKPRLLSSIDKLK